MPLLTADQRRRLHTYVYSGGDSSPVYKHVLSPLAQYCVDHFVPMWMAPNAVTLLGLIASIIAFTCTLILDPHLQGTGPRWLYLLTGCCIFIYQTLDNMDGKQARRTGTSSALGMLFDHGCDAVNTVLMIVAMSAVVASGWTTRIFLCIFSGFVPFYFQTWEEYYVGSMVLPPFNGPTEGLLIAAGMGILAYVLGPQFFHQVLFESPLVDSIVQPVHRYFGLHWYPDHGVTPFLCAWAFTTIVSSCIAAKQVYNVFVKVHERGDSLVKPALDLLPFLVFLPSIMYYCAASDIALQKYPLVTFLFISATFVDMVVHMMVNHICHAPLQPFRRTGAYLMLLLAILTRLRPPRLFGLDPELLLLCVSAVFAARHTGLMLFQMCTESAKELDIYVLSLGKPSQRTAGRKL